MEPNPNTPDLSSETVIPGTSLNPDPNAIADTHNSLDALFKQVVPGEADPAPKADDTPPTPAPAASPAAPVVPPVTPAVPPAEPAAPVVPPVAPTAPAAPASPPEDYNSISLPQYAKPATTEAFTKVKMLAGAKIDSLTKEKDELAAKLKEVEGKVGKIPAETEQELNELRAFRKRLDVEYDPSFKQFDTQVKQNDESILGKLKEAGVADAQIKQIREMGVADVDWEGILPKLPPNVRRFVEAKLVQSDDLREQKSRALEAAKQNADKFLTEREQAFEQHSKELAAQARKELDGHLVRFPWSQRKAIAPTATAEEKTAAETHNKFVDEVDAAIQDAIGDDSPNMKAILTLGYLQALRLQKEIAVREAGLKAQETAWATEKAKLEAALKEKEDFINRIKKSAGASHLSVPVVPGGQAPISKVHEPGAEALDRLRSEQEAAQ